MKGLTLPTVNLVFFHFQGSYDNYECGLEISNADAADEGKWSCDIESYVKYGKRGDGKMATVSFETYWKNAASKEFES